MRGIEPDRTEDARQQDGASIISRGRGGGSDPIEARSPERETAQPRTRRYERRERVWFRDRSHSLRRSELEAMTEIGKFRVVNLEDLIAFHYRGDRRRAEQDLRNLRSQGLIHRIRVSSPSGGRVNVLALTRHGKGLLARNPQKTNDLQEQKIYSGFVKPRELLHDTAIYRMYQIEAEKLRAEGGAIGRIVLDYELKEKVFRPLAKAHQSTGADSRRRQDEIVQVYDLPMIEGKIAFPDLRIEYETRDGERCKVDLEVTTEHYRPAQLAAKMQTGFRIHFASTKDGCGSVKEEREITAGILSL